MADVCYLIWKANKVVRTLDKRAVEVNINGYAVGQEHLPHITTWWQHVTSRK